MRIKLLACFLMMAYWGCTSDKFDLAIPNQLFTGKVIDFTTGYPVSNANVILAREYLIGHLGDQRNFDYTTTDAYGNFSFKVVPNKRNCYSILASKSGYTFVDTTFQLTLTPNLFDSVTEYHDTVFLDVSSILQINFHDLNPSSFSDTLYIRVGFGDSSNINPFWGNHIHQTLISYNNTFQFFDSASYKLNCYASILYLNLSQFRPYYIRHHGNAHSFWNQDYRSFLLGYGNHFSKGRVNFFISYHLSNLPFLLVLLQIRNFQEWISRTSLQKTIFL